MDRIIRMLLGRLLRQGIKHVARQQGGRKGSRGGGQAGRGQASGGSGGGGQTGGKQAGGGQGSGGQGNSQAKAVRRAQKALRAGRKIGRF